MDTEPGGESGQYEGNLGYIEPHNKQAGQLGGTLFTPCHAYTSYPCTAFKF